MFASGNYVRKGHRRTLLRHIASSARSPWPPSTPFTFKNLYKCVGWGWFCLQQLSTQGPGAC